VDYLDEASFIVGAVVGAAVAGIFGYILAQLRKSQKAAGALDNAQSVSQKTAKTPRQVVQESMRALFRSLFWGTILVAFVGVIGFAFFRLMMPF
jgi:hypothetical protein